MATNKNITMKQFNGADYDTLYPKTKVEQVEGAYTQQQILSDATKRGYGLGSDAVPDDVLALIKILVSNAQESADGSAKLEVGSYVGTGGTSVVLNYTRVPKLVFVRGRNEPDSAGSGSYPHGSFLLAAYGATKIFIVFFNSETMGHSYVTLTWGKNSLTMTATDTNSGRPMGLNVSSQTYDYVFIS